MLSASCVSSTARSCSARHWISPACTACHGIWKVASTNCFQMIDKTVRIRDMSLRDVQSSHPVDIHQRQLRQQIAKGGRLWWPSEKARQPQFFSDFMALTNTACSEKNTVVEEFDTFDIQWLQTSLDPVRGGPPSEAENGQTDLWFLPVLCCNFVFLPRATRLI